MEVLVVIGLVIGCYIIGSFPTGYLLVKLKTGEDIRKYGSGSTGATNVKRRLGTWGFVVVMIVDLLKGLLPVLLVKEFFTVNSTIIDPSIVAVLVSLSLITGHSKSIFLNFSGGKSAATGAGTIIGLCWPVGLITMIIWSLIVYTTKYISLASIIAVFMTPLLMYYFNQPFAYVVYTLIGALYIGIYLHRDNIKRLIEGKESRINK